MIQFNYGSEEVYELPNEPKEMSLGQFEKIFNITNNDNLGLIEKYMKVFEMLGLPDEVLDSMNQQEFVEAVKKFNDYMIHPTTESKIEINGHTYVSFAGEEFEFMAKDLMKIEKAAISGDGHFPSMLMAILFKDESLTNTEHYTDAHIKHKAKLFREHLTADMCLPYLARVARRTVTTLEDGV